jgi:thiol:disulfide interchange protein
MRKYLAVLILILFFGYSQGQMVKPVKWTWKAEKVKDNEYNLVITAVIEKDWHTFSQFIEEGGPVATSFIFEKNTDVVFEGKVTEKADIVKEGIDPDFKTFVKSYEGKAIFTQKVKVLRPTKVKGVLTFMACHTVCIAPEDIDFEFDLAVEKGEAIPVLPATNPTLPVADNSTVVSTEGADSAAAPIIAEIPTIGESTDKYGKPLQDCGIVSVETKDQTLWQIMVLGFLGGLIALLTPCVFPMIPLTVSFFTKRNENPSRGKLEAVLYAFSIVFIYFLLAVPFLLFNISPDTLNEFSTGAPLNVFFFLIFVVFAFSFFGYYEITLPSFIANKADSASNTGGIIGIFFMAVTLAIVSFSCTGPIIGSLLVGSLTSSGGKLNLVAGMTSFGFALALPFGLFAFFPSLLKSLPKSGGWMTTVKVVLGFVELVFAIKFLSNADMVSHWGILKREVFLGIWMLLGIGLFLYLIGKIKFPHDYPTKMINKTKLVLAGLSLVFVLYTATGLFGQDLTFFSGFPPPKFYSVMKQDLKLEPLRDYNAAVAEAKRTGKPLMVDFTGWACVNCRKMEENVWTDPEVFMRLKEEYVIVSLYVDDKEKLPENEQYVSDFSQKKIKTIGNKWSDMQAKHFNSNTQPYYVLLSPEEKLLTTPVGNTPDKKKYIEFLDCGISAAKQAKAVSLNTTGY